MTSTDILPQTQQSDPASTRPRRRRLAAAGASLAAAIPRNGMRSILVRTLIILLPAFAVAAAIFLLFARTESDKQLKLLEKQQLQSAEVATLNFEVGIAAGIADARFLALERTVSEWMESGTSADVSSIQAQYSAFLQEKPDYDSIRVIDADGMELVRVDLDSEGRSQIVPRSELQNKEERYYFQQALKLARGDVFVSRLDLNVEHGVIEKPIRPTLRFAAPIFDSAGVRRAIIVLNLHAQDLLWDLRREGTIRNNRIWLVDRLGFWLMGPDPAQDWGFMYPDRASSGFSLSYPEAWSAMSASDPDRGTIKTPKGFFAFLRANEDTAKSLAHRSPRGTIVRPKWYIVSYVSPTDFTEITEEGDRRMLQIWLAVALLIPAAGAAGGYHWHHRAKNKRRVAALSEKLARDNRTLAAVNQELEAFSYSVSHDLRTPLRSIDGFSQALLEDYGDVIDDVGQNYLFRVRRAAQRMGYLIDDLLALSRVSRVEISISDLDLGKIAGQVIRGLEEADPERTVTWSVEPDIPGRGDPRLVRVLLENLLGNAWKFTSKTEAARISFTQVSGAGELLYRVSDNGAGFDMEFAEKLFSAFQRLHGFDEFPGTGIGLATVQRIVNRHGGRIWAEAEPDKGATFYFTLGKGDK